MTKVIASVFTWDNDIKLNLEHSLLDWMLHNIFVVIKMIHLQLNESVLILSYSTKVLTVQFLKMLSIEHDCIININSI